MSWRCGSRRSGRCAMWFSKRMDGKPGEPGRMPVAADLRVIQLGLNTSDLPATARLYAELFGFVNAGGKLVWGEPMRLAGLERSARATIWWMVGPQPFFQLELFHHTEPSQRPLRPDWTPADHGWTRFGVAVQSFAKACTVLDKWGIAPIGVGECSLRGRRLAFRDPFVGCVVELMEAPEGLSSSAETPRVVYAASSVGDLDAARHFYEGSLELPIRPLSDLHDPADEALWGLAESQRNGFVVDTSGTKLEI